MYVLTDISTEEVFDISNISNLFMNMSFENKINTINEKYTQDQETQSSAARSAEINDFFETKKENPMDVILLPESGLTGRDRFVLTSTSILYIRIYGNVKLGFYVDKDVINTILPEEEVGDLFETA